MRIFVFSPIVVMILEGQNTILSNRKIMGATNPKDVMRTRSENYMEFQ